MKIVTNSLGLSPIYIPVGRAGQAAARAVLLILALFNLAGQAALSQPDDTVMRSTGSSGLRDDETSAASGQPSTTPTQPALNVITPPNRQPLAAPPETPPEGLRGAQAIAVQKGAAPVSLPQAWRIKAFSLFKAGANSDKNNSILSTKLASPYRSAFESVRKALGDNNLTIEALSLSAGHILVSSPNLNPANLNPANINNDGGTEKAIIALRQSTGGDGTDVKVFCDAKNRALTMARLKPMLDQLSGGAADLNNRSGANSL